MFSHRMMGRESGLEIVNVKLKSIFISVGKKTALEIKGEHECRKLGACFEEGNFVGT